MKLPLIHLSKSKKLEVYQVIGLMDLSMRSPCIELLMRFKKIKLFQYCYMEHITIFYELAENTRNFIRVDESASVEL